MDTRIYISRCEEYVHGRISYSDHPCCERSMNESRRIRGEATCCSARPLCPRKNFATSLLYHRQSGPGVLDGQVVICSNYTKMLVDWTAVVDHAISHLVA